MPLLFPHISTPSRILTHIPTLDLSIPVPQGQILLTAHESKRQRGGEGPLCLGHFVLLWLQGSSTYVDGDTEHAAWRQGRQSGRRNTRAWQIELAAVRRMQKMGAGLLTQEWQRKTGHVKFMASPGLRGNTSPTGDWQAPYCETVVALLKPWLLLLFWLLNCRQYNRIQA